jgi:hypothetical protein
MPKSLRDWLLSASDWREAVRLATPSIRSQCRDLLPAVASVCGPTSLADVMIAIAPLMLHFDPRSFGPGETGESLTEAWEASFAESLTDIPREALEFATAKWIRTGRFYPKVAELRACAQEKADILRSISWRVKMIAQSEEPRPPISEEERAQVKAMIAQMQTQIAEGRFFRRWEPRASTPRLSRHEVAEALRALA